MDISTEAQLTWPRTGSTGNGKKIICPECGLSGYLGGKWTRKHAEHVTCSCGQVVSAQGLAAHRGSKARHGRPCP